MLKITPQDFLLMQPSFPKATPSDPYYLEVADALTKKWQRSVVFENCPDPVRKKVILGVVGYYQDIISDAGLWRSFISEHKRLYGKWLPFFDVTEEYIEFELNIEDVRFMVWYTLAMLWEEMRLISPLDERIRNLAEIFYVELDDRYEDAPEPDGFNLARELDTKNPEDADGLFRLGQWLFLHSYLLTPSYATTLQQIMSEPKVSADASMAELRNRLEESMMEDPIGPLALFLREWIFLLVDGKTFLAKEPEPTDQVHPYYQKFIDSEGYPVRFFGSYGEMNDFFINTLGWDAGEEHLPQLKEAHDFALYVNPEKGMLVARDVCRCILHPLNPYYEESYAKEHAIEFFTVRGRCPVDLVKYLAENNYLPDACYKGNRPDYQLIRDNWDFIARCYLQQYYTD